MVGATLAAGLLAFAVASFVLVMARNPAKVLTIQHALARVLDVVYTCNQSQPNFADVQTPCLALSTSSIALPGTAAHRFVTRFGASNRGRVLVASNLFRVFAVREPLLHHLLTFDGLQVLKLVAEHDESSHLYR